MSNNVDHPCRTEGANGIVVALEVFSLCSSSSWWYKPRAQVVWAFQDYFVLQQSAIFFTHWRETGERSYGVSGFNYIPGHVLNSLGLSVHGPKFPEGTKNCP